MPEQIELLTLPEGAKTLRIKLSTMRDWVLHRKIPYVKCGRLVRLRQSDIESFIASRTVQPLTDGSLAVA